MFIRRRISPSNRRTLSYQLIESYREGGKIRQRVIACLGPHSTIEAALEATRGEIASARAALKQGMPAARKRGAIMRRLARAKKLLATLESVVSSKHTRTCILDTTKESETVHA